MIDKLKTVLIAVPTTGARPLLPLLEELYVQSRAAERGGRTVSVLLLDNSGGGSEWVRAAVARNGVTCQQVSDRGFAQVRNAALDLAAHYDALVFIDDDERPCYGWLETLVNSAEKSSADVVVGPVPVRLPPAAPRWLDGGAVLRPMRSQPDGPLHGPANSGNTLIRMATIQRLGVRFRPAFDRVGGEDTVFFTELAQRGATLVWAGAAVAQEIPDPERLTLSWTLRRAYRAGRAVARLERTLGPALFARRMHRRAGRIARGLARLLWGAVRRNSPDCVRGLMDFAFAGGWLAESTCSRGRELTTEPLAVDRAAPGSRRRLARACADETRGSNDMSTRESTDPRRRVE
ncbi:glycosyltransferase family 2 protein [Actinacidiphila soli]|uniref:glycosyltransferase family 2 protein n=1 Tax=Actinacidiphila soli TaxID=2487275 RepID=UPI000FC9BD1E|nr:glycosyltransferase [Actinacidiphila soli]